MRVHATGFAVALLASASGVAAGNTRTATADNEPPPIVVERRGSGVLAETWRHDGPGFAAHGPDDEGVAATPEREVLRALSAAERIEFVALAAPPPGERFSACRGDCIADLPVLARIPAVLPDERALARDVLGGWLPEPGGLSSSCGARWHHALAFRADGHDWDVLFSYVCSQYRIRRDGVDLVTAEASAPGPAAGFNALMASDVGLRFDPAPGHGWTLID